MKTEQTPYYQTVLKRELATRIEKNSQYSMRAFAKSMKVEPSALSKIMGGKRFLTEKLAGRIFKTLQLTFEEEEKFLQSIAHTKNKQGVGRFSPGLKKFLGQKEGEPTRELSIEAFKVISEWYHYAILELTFTESFQSNQAWIAQRLGITESETKLAVARLLDIGLLIEEKGQYRKADRWIDSYDKTKTSTAHRRRQKKLLQKSIESLENDMIEKRNHSAITLPIDPDKIPEAKKMIADFMWNLTHLLSAEKKKEVYELTVNLFPLSKAEK